MKTDTLNPRVFVIQQTAALAAGTQDRMWNFIETFYHEQGREYTNYVTESYIVGIAEQVPGLQLEQWNNDRDTQFARQVVADNRTARVLGMHDTPGFTIGPTGGKMHVLVAREPIIKFPGYRRMKHPVSLITVTDLRDAIKQLS